MTLNQCIYYLFGGSYCWSKIIIPYENENQHFSYFKGSDYLIKPWVLPNTNLIPLCIPYRDNSNEDNSYREYILKHSQLLYIYPLEKINAYKSELLTFYSLFCHPINNQVSVVYLPKYKLYVGRGLLLDENLKVVLCACRVKKSPLLRNSYCVLVKKDIDEIAPSFMPLFKKIQQILKNYEVDIIFSDFLKIDFMMAPTSTDNIDLTNLTLENI